MEVITTRSKNKLKRGSGSWKAVVFVFFSIVFVFALVNFFSKNRSVEPEGASNRSAWDGSSPFALLILGENDYLTVMQREPKRIISFKIDGLVEDDLAKEEAVNRVSALLGTVVSSYLYKESGSDLKDDINDFSSVLTPVKILAGGVDESNTNVSRIDALRLWWQVKGLGSNEPELIDLTTYVQGEGNSVLGSSNSQLNRIVQPYLENNNILSENIDVKVVNRTGSNGASLLFDTFLSTSGGRVVEIIGSSDTLVGCEIEGEESYTRDYLAKTFDCDIKDRVFEGPSEGNLTITIGQDFADAYF